MRRHCVSNANTSTNLQDNALSNAQYSSQMTCICGMRRSCIHDVEFIQDVLCKDLWCMGPATRVAEAMLRCCS